MKSKIHELPKINKYFVSKTLKTTIVFLALLIFTFSCSKDDAPALTPVKQPSAEVSFENTNTVNIPDISSTTSNINVTTSGTILDLKKIILEMNVAHTYQNDLSFTLISPDGTESLFIKRIGGSADYVSTNKLRFSGAYTDAISNSNVDIPAGDYIESQGNGSNATPVLLPIFSTFQDKNITGTWKLKITDHSLQVTGQIKSWKLIFQTGALNQ